MPRFLPVLFLVTVAVCAQDISTPELTNYEVLAEALANNTVPGLVILDVRPRADYLAGHIPGSINLSGDELFSGFPSKVATTPILVYGRPASSDARKAVDILKTRGYRNVILFGSISQWKGKLD